MSKKSKKIILILVLVILVILVAILHYKIIDARYMKIDKESDRTINESANVYIDFIDVDYNNGKTLGYSLSSNGTAKYIAGYSGILEYEKDGVWYSLKYKRLPISEKPISCAPDEIVYRQFFSEWHYGLLLKGHYRFIRTIAEERLNPYLISIEFDIE